MTEAEVNNLPLEQIIRLPNFLSLTNHDGLATRFWDGDGPVRTPYWEIRFRATPIPGKRSYVCFGREIIFDTYVMYRLKDDWHPNRYP